MDTLYIVGIGIAVAVVATLIYVLLIRGRSVENVSARQSSQVSISSPKPSLKLSFFKVFTKGIDDGTWSEIEEVLLAGDVGVAPTTRIVEAVRSAGPKTAEEAWTVLEAAVIAEFEGKDRTLNLWGEPAVILVVGVNGSGKTTTVAKLAHRLHSEGKMVVLAAADTFRAAGSSQLAVWAERIGVSVVTGQEGGDSAAVVHDALESARARGAEVVIVDTAGRLHANKNLMAELEKVHRVAGGAGGVGEVLLVLDASAGQNGLNQAREFAAAVPLTGVALTKLDGTAKGGIVIAIESTLGVPVKLVGTGETISQLEVFEPASFVPSLLSER